MFAWGTSSPVSSMGHTRVTLSLDVLALMWVLSSRSNYPSISVQIGKSRSKDQLRPGPLLCIKPSPCCKASSCNEPCHRHHCTSIPTTRRAYWLQPVIVRTCVHVCVYVMYVCMLARAHLIPARSKGIMLLSDWLESSCIGNHDRDTAPHLPAVQVKTIYTSPG